jgi:hypothetical protein
MRPHETTSDVYAFILPSVGLTHLIIKWEHGYQFIAFPFSRINLTVGEKKK